MHSQSNEQPDHRHPEIERDIAKRFTLLHEFMAQGFADILRGFERVDARFDEVDRRFDAVERRLDAHDKRFDAIDAHLRRIGPNGQQP